MLLPPEARSVRSSYETAVEFNQHWWDFHGPIYLGVPKNKENSPKNKSTNFLVADIISYRQVTVVDAESFMDRVEDVRRRWRSLTINPVFIGASFSIAAWNMLRSTLPCRSLCGSQMKTLSSKLTSLRSNQSSLNSSVGSSRFLPPPLLPSPSATAVVTKT